jgi:hypothetical protein
VWQLFLRKLHRSGLQTAPWQGPDTVCTAAAQTFPRAAGQLAAINRIFVQLRYGRHRDSQLVGALRRRVRQLRLR